MNNTSNYGVNSTGAVNNGQNPLGGMQPIMPNVNNQVINPVQQIQPIPNQVGQINNVQVSGGAPVTPSLPPVNQIPAGPSPVVSNAMPTSVNTIPTVSVAPVQPIIEPSVQQPINIVQPPVQNTVQQPTLQQPIVQQPAPVINSTPAMTPTPVTEQPKVETSMPMIPNVDNLIASAPVNTAPQASQKTIEENKPSEAKVEFNMNSNVKIDVSSAKDKKKEKKVKKVNDDYDNDEYVHSNRAPLVMAGLFITLLVLIFVYYFVIMKPQRVFDKAINTTVDYLKDIVTGVETSNKRMKFDLGFALNTNNDEFKDEVSKGWQDPINYIKDDYLNGTIYVDTINQDTRVQLKSYKKLDNFKNITFNGKPVMNEDGTYNDDKLKAIIESGIDNGTNESDNALRKSNFIDSKNVKDYTKMLDFSFYSVGVPNEENGKKENSQKIFIGPIEYINYNDVQKWSNDFGSVRKDQDGTQKLIIKDTIKDLEDNISSKLKNIFSNNESKLANFLDLKNMNFNYDTIDSFVNIAEVTKNKIIEEIKESELERSIVLKKIDKTTTVALKAHTLVGEKRIGEIYKKIFEDFYNSEKTEKIIVKDKETGKEVEKEINILDEFANILGADKEKIRTDLIGYLKDRKVVTKSVEVNLYMNLANTDLIALDICVDKKYYVELNSLNGYFKINIRVADEDEDVRLDKTHKALDIIAVYDRSNGIVNGRGIIDNDNTFLTVTFKYTRNKEQGVKNGNNLTLGFYKDTRLKNMSENEIYDLMSDENLKKILNKDGGLPAVPFCLLRCDLTIYNSDDAIDAQTSKEETSFDLKKEVENSKVMGDDYTTNKVGFNGTSTLLNVFVPHFTSHIEYLVDHLLFNKIDRKHQKEIKEETSNKEEKVEETSNQVEENKTEEIIKENVDNSNKTNSDENTNANNSTIESNTSTENSSTEIESTVKDNSSKENSENNLTNSEKTN